MGETSWDLYNKNTANVIANFPEFAAVVGSDGLRLDIAGAVRSDGLRLDISLALIPTSNLHPHEKQRRGLWVSKHLDHDFDSSLDCATSLYFCAYLPARPPFACQRNFGCPWPNQCVCVCLLLEDRSARFYGSAKPRVKRSHPYTQRWSSASPLNIWLDDERG